MEINSFYINLDRREDRKIFMESQFKKNKLFKNIERFSAVDGYKIHPRNLPQGLLSENAIRDILMDTVTSWGLSLTQGGLGVLLSYMSLFEKISKLDSAVLTFEDDVIVNDEFNDYIKSIIKELPEDFDFCYLGYGEKDLEKTPYSKHLSIPTGIITCLPSLLISPKGAQRLIDVLKNVDNQIDTAIYLKLKEFKVFVSNIKLVEIRNSFKSDIQGNNSCKKDYPKQNYIFATLAYGENANQNALKLAHDLNYFKQKILIVTTQKSLYNSLENVITIEYPEKNFSYNDKIICFEEGFKYQDCVVYLDSDCRIFYEDFKGCYTNFFRIVPPGIHPSWLWGKINRDDSGFFQSKDVIGRVPGYGEMALKISNDLGIDINEADHYQEGFMVISKENGKEQILLDTWKTFSRQLDEYEISSGLKIKNVGIGEGNLFGLSLVKSGITVNPPDYCNIIGTDLRYNFFGIYRDAYLVDTPNRKTVVFGDGVWVKTEKKIVKFEDKLIELSYSIFEINDNLMILSFNWNNNNAVEFLDHEFRINGNVYHFNSDKTNELHFEKTEKTEIFHTYDWYGNKDWTLIDTL